MHDGYLMDEMRQQQAADGRQADSGRCGTFSEEDSQIADRAHALLRQRDGGEGKERHEERGPAKADDAGDHILGVKEVVCRSSAE